MRTVAILLAREGSKRLPHKNLLDFCGKPMFQWNLEKALALFKEVYVSSDSSRILETARKLGATAIARPPELARGDVPHMPVFMHALPLMANPDVVVSVQTNSPTLASSKIKTALHIIEDKEVKEITTIYRDFKIHGSVWALKRERIENYGDPYVNKAEVFMFDSAVDIHTLGDFERAEADMQRVLANEEVKNSL